MLKKYLCHKFFIGFSMTKIFTVISYYITDYSYNSFEIVKND